MTLKLHTLPAILITLSWLTNCGPKPPDRSAEVLGGLKKSTQQQQALNTNAAGGQTNSSGFQVDCNQGLEQIPDSMRGNMSSEQVTQFQDMLVQQCGSPGTGTPSY